MARIIVSTESGEERSHDLAGPQVSLGRSPRNAVQVDDTAASRRHCKLEERPGGWVLVDLGSSNGTLVNDRKVSEHPLRHGDVIRIGGTRIRFEEEVELEIGGEAGEDSWLVFESGERAGERLPVPRGRSRAGRGPRNRLHIDAPGVSAVHFELQRGAGGTVVRDLGSTNGTFVNGARVGEHPLQDGDVVRAGTATLRFVAPREALPGGPESPGVSARAGTLPRRRRFRSALISFPLAGVVVVAAVLVYRAASREAPYQFPDPPRGSLIGDGWSFEEPGSLGSWQAGEGVELAAARGRAHTGRRSLVLALPSHPAAAPAVPSLRLATLAERFAIPASGVVRLVAWVDGGALEGMAGGAVRWYPPGGAGEPVGVAFTPFVGGEGGFRAVEGSFHPPPEAAEMEVAAVCFARGGEARFDDFVLLEAPGAGRAPASPLESGGFELRLGSKGEACLLHAGRRVVRDLQVVRTVDGYDWPQTVFLVPRRSEGGETHSVTGEVLEPDGSSGGTLTVEASVGDSGFRLEDRLAGPAAGVSFLLHPLLVEGGVTVISGERWRRHYEDFEGEAAEALLVGGAAQLLIRFDPALRLETRTGPEGLLCVGRPVDPQGGGTSMAVEIQTSFEQERSMAQRLLIDARSARREGRLGESLRLLEEIRDKLPYNPRILLDAERELGALEGLGERAAAEVRSLRDEAAFFGTPGHWRAVLERCGVLAGRFAGSRFGQGIEDAGKEAAAALERLEEERRLRRADLLLRRGEDLAGTGHPSIATVVLEAVVRRFPDTDPARAAGELLADLGERSSGPHPARER